MNVLTTTWRQLVRRRLWPVAVLLIAALAAVPFLLARQPAPVSERPSTGTSAETVNVEDALADPVVAKAAPEDRDRRRRVLGARKNPFQPAPLPKPKKKKTAAKQTAKKHATTPDTPKTSGGTSVPTGSTIPVTTTPVGAPTPPKKTYAKDSLIVRFGDATSDLERLNVKKLEPLPDDEDPLLIYMGLTDHGKKAVFLVDESLDATGDGDCKPHPSSCEKIELAKGETEFFDVIDDESGDIVAQYELDLVDIK
jgi:hypothetical protein